MVFKNRWTAETIHALYALPFFKLIDRAYDVHQLHFPNHAIQISTLLSIKTGACPEDCAYCPQSARHNVGLPIQRLMKTEDILQAASVAKVQGATRFCMGAAWRDLPEKSLPQIIEIIRGVKALGLETCMTLGMLTRAQAQALQAAGLDYYNHNLDSSAEFYKTIITTRTYQDRLDTLEHVRQSGMKVCCGGILGMGETREDRVQFLLQLSALSEPPESIPMNRLIPIPGTPLGNAPPLDTFEFIRTVAITRILFPNAMIRFAAGRESVSAEMQALCFMAGVNSIFVGERLLTAPNPAQEKDWMLLKTLGLKPMTPQHDSAG